MLMTDKLNVEQKEHISKGRTSNEMLSIVKMNHF